MKLSRLFNYFVFVILVYVYFYDPFYIPNVGFLGQGDKQYSIFLLYILSILYFFTNSKDAKKKCRIFKVEFLLLVLLIVLSFIITINGGELTLFAKQIKYLLASFFVPIFFVHLCESMGFNDEGVFIKIILLVGSLAAIGTIICVIAPAIGDIYKQSVIFIDSGNFLLEGFRGFGFSTRLTNDFGYIQGAVFAIGLYYGKNNKWFFPLALFVLLSALLNARTGVIIAIVGVLFIFLFNKRNKYYLLISTILASVLFIIIPQIEKILIYLGLEDKTVVWVSEFLLDMDSIFMSRNYTSTGIAETIFSDMVLWPESMSAWLLGIGHSVFKPGFHSGGHSDVGFIIQLNYGGIFYFSVLMLLMIRLFKRLWNNGYKYISVFGAASFIILNIKSNFALREGGALGLFLIIYYFLIYYSNKKSHSHIYRLYDKRISNM